jgi:hypothetical protein
LVLGCALVAWAGCKRTPPPELTGKNAAAFAAHVDKMVVLQGRMEEGRHGLVLYGPIPPDVNFCIMSAQAGAKASDYPEVWAKRMNREVRVTGMLRLRKLEGPGGSPLTRGPVDFYYMVLQQAQIADPIKK